MGKLGGDPYFFPVAAGQCLREDRFALPEVVDRGCVDIIDATIDSVPNLPDRAFLVNPSHPVRGKAHAAETEDRKLVAGFWD